MSERCDICWHEMSYRGGSYGRMYCYNCDKNLAEQYDPVRTDRKVGVSGQGMAENGAKHEGIGMPGHKGPVGNQGGGSTGLRQGTEKCHCATEIIGKIDKLTEAILAQAESLIIQSGAIHALADAIATPIDEPEAPATATDDDSEESFMDGRPFY